MKILAGVLLLLGFFTQQPTPAVETLPTPTAGTYLGVLFAPVSSNNPAGKIPIPSGVVVTQVLANSPADKAGLRRNDLLQCYDQERLTSCEQLARLIQNDQPGRVVKLEVLRGTSGLMVEARLGVGPGLRMMGESRAGTGGTASISKPAVPKLAAEIEPLPNGRLRVHLQYYPEGTGRLTTRTLTGTLSELQREVASFSAEERRLVQVLVDRLKQLELTPAPPRP